MLNKDFVKQLFKGDKVLLPASKITPVNIPKYDELAVKSIFPLMRKDEAFMRHFSDR